MGASTTPPPLIMFLTFEESVLDAADNNGNLTERNASRLLKLHGFSLKDAAEDAHGEPVTKLAQHHAQTLLNWLGY